MPQLSVLDQNYVLSVLCENKIDREVLDQVIGISKPKKHDAGYFLLCAVYWYLNNLELSSRHIQYIFAKSRHCIYDFGDKIWRCFLEKSNKFPLYNLILVDREYVSWTGNSCFYSLKTGEKHSELSTPIESTAYNLVSIFRQFYFLVYEECFEVEKAIVKDED